MGNPSGVAGLRSIGSLGAAALAVLLCFVPPDVPAQGRERFSVHALEGETHERINAHRRTKGLPPLAYDYRVAEIARRHSESMAGGHVPIGHEGFELRRNRIAGIIPLKAMAENVGFNTYPADGTVSAAVSGWLESPRHRENIEGDYDVTGVGIAPGPEGAWYYTQIFVKRARSRVPRPAS